jgi:hypothetical protein
LAYLDDEEEEDWNLYIVSMYDWYTEEPIQGGWPVMAPDFEAAMTVYEVLLRLANDKIVGELS